MGRILFTSRRCTRIPDSTRPSRPLLFSVQALGSVLGQDLLDGFQTLFGDVVEGRAALADVVALQGDSSLDDGVGVAVLEGLLQDGDRVLSGLCAFEVASLEAVVDLCNSGRPDVCCLLYTSDAADE